MLDTNELLSKLKLIGARNVDIARVLGLPDSRVPEIYSGKRQLKLDEAVKLVRAYELDEQPTGDSLSPVSAPIARLLVLHVARELGLDPRPEVISNLAEDLRAFSELALDRTVRDSVQAVDGFLRGLRLRTRDVQASLLTRHPPKTQ